MKEFTEGQHRAIKSIAHVVEEKIREIEKVISFSNLSEEPEVQLEVVNNINEMAFERVCRVLRIRKREDKFKPYDKC